MWCAPPQTVCASKCLSLDFSSLRATLEVKRKSYLPGALRWVTAFRNFSQFVGLWYICSHFHCHLSHPSCGTLFLWTELSAWAWSNIGRNRSAVTLTSAVFDDCDSGVGGRWKDIFMHWVCFCVCLHMCGNPTKYVFCLTDPGSKQRLLSCWFADVWKINTQYVHRGLKELILRQDHVEH